MCFLFCWVKQGVVESLTNIWGGLLFTKTRRRTSGTFFTFLVSNSSRSWCTTRSLSWLGLSCKTFVMFSYSSFSYPCILISSYPHLSILSDTHLPPYPHQERFQLCFVQLLHNHDHWEVIVIVTIIVTWKAASELPSWAVSMVTMSSREKLPLLASSSYCGQRAFFMAI